MKYLFILLLHSGLCAFAYLSPGITIGKHEKYGFFISTQISYGIVFVDASDWTNQDIADLKVPFVPSVCLGVKYYPKLKHKPVRQYVDLQISIPIGALLNYEGPGMVGYAYGWIKEQNWIRKNKYYIGPGLLFYNIDIKSSNNSINSHSLSAVFPLPVAEWIPSNLDWDQDSIAE